MGTCPSGPTRLPQRLGYQHGSCFVPARWSSAHSSCCYNKRRTTPENKNKLLSRCWWLRRVLPRAPAQRRRSLVDHPRTFNWLSPFSSSACEGNFVTQSPLKLWMDDDLCESLFLCACLLKVSNCVHAFQLYIGWPLHSVWKVFSHNKPIIPFFIYFFCHYFISNHLLQTNGWPIKGPVPKWSVCTWLVCQTWYHACAYGTDVVQLNICSCFI